MKDLKTARKLCISVACVLEGAEPHIGEIGVHTLQDEYKIEICYQKERLEETVVAIRAVHPYEVPVINAIPLLPV